MRTRSGLRVMVVTLAVAVGMASGLVGPLPAEAKARPAKTTKVEAKRVGSVKTPKLRWYPCYDYAECVTVKLPRDYDRPTGAKVSVSLLRVKARNQKKKIGSLFVNPGGPGGSAVEFAYAAPEILGSALLDRFDIVGMDPRGTNFSSQVSCFKGPRGQGPVLADLSMAFPYTSAEETRYVRGSQKLGRACSTTGKPLTGAVSTAQVARDMDVMRRAVGDKKLNYLGFSYGSFLGEVYANMFPDRFRTMAIDGVIDPVAWAGTRATQAQPQTDRLRSADGATKALREVLRRCDRVGGARCEFAPGDPVANFDLVAQRLKKKPLRIDDPFTGEAMRFGYADLIGTSLDALYATGGAEEIAMMMSELIILTEPPAGKRRPTTTKRQASLKRLSKRLKAIEMPAPKTRPTARLLGFPYDNSLDAYTTIMCTDSLNPAKTTDWIAAGKAADRRARYFGRAWAWSSAPCARKSWTVKDEDAYRGPFNRVTAAPVLIVGSTWDPATNYAGAVKTAALMPNSRLLTSNNWGHTAYGTSACVSRAMERYLVKGQLPAKGKRCTGDYQPFVSDPWDLEDPMDGFVRPVKPIDGVVQR